MYQYRISSTLTMFEGTPEPGECVLILLTSEELERKPCIAGLEQILCHTPTARDAHVCKAETHRNYLCGTVVTTIFLPLSPVAGWYGMNFRNMPELTWKYGYIAVIAFSILIVLICLFIMKKKKFW